MGRRRPCSLRFTGKDSRSTGEKSFSSASAPVNQRTMVIIPARTTYDSTTTFQPVIAGGYSCSSTEGRLPIGISFHDVRPSMNLVQVIAHHFSTNNVTLSLQHDCHVWRALLKSWHTLRDWCKPAAPRPTASSAKTARRLALRIVLPPSEIC